MQQQARFAGFAQRSAKGRHQLVGQAIDETDRIRQHHRCGTGQIQAPQGRVQRRKQLIGGIDARIRQGIKQGGFAGIGIAHQRHRRQISLASRPATLFALPVDPVQAQTNLPNAIGEQAPVSFQLGFTGTPQANAAALPLQVRPAPHQPGGQVTQLRQLYLQLAFKAARALGENIQDQSGTIHNPALQERFQIALLTRRQAVIEDHQFGTLRPYRIADFLGLASTDKQARVRSLAPTANQRPALSTRRKRQILKLGQVAHIGGCLAKHQMHQDGTFAAARPLEQAASCVRSRSCQG